ncbi:MAG TPA: thiamine phosphate synthase [Sphingomicrobium sp.]|jgi:thiamine-phosphate pyrophosphorylase
MPRRQTSPSRWLLVTDANSAEVLELARQLPAGSGILVLVPLVSSQMLRLRYIAALRRLTVTEEAPGAAARVHNIKELRRALLRRTDIIMLSPLYPTRSHPDWQPLGRMQAAAVARLGGRRLVALGGMDAKRYARVARLGFSGWAGISAFRT